MFPLEHDLVSAAVPSKCADLESAWSGLPRSFVVFGGKKIAYFFESGNRFFINLRQPFPGDLYKNNLVEELRNRGVYSAKIIFT